MKTLHALWNVLVAELALLATKPVYWFCMLLIPLFLIFYFTNLMEKGLPKDMPVAIVDLDNSKTSRTLMRMLDSYQSAHIVAHYASISDARKATQDAKIYGFFYIPQGTEEKMIGGRQPMISFYYNASVMIAGSLIYKDMRAIATMAQAAMGQAKMRAKGMSDKDIKAQIQPIVIDAHATNNPFLNYSMYLNTTLIPACIALFIFIVTAYSFGGELKFGHAKKMMKTANNSIAIAMTGKMVPQTIIWTIVIWTYEYWLYYANAFTHNCSFGFLMLLGLLLVLASQGMGIFMFGIFPSMRMSMSIGALWAVLSFSVTGFTFPVTSMDTAIQAMSWLFPVRSHYMIYQIHVLNGFPAYYALSYFFALICFTLLPLLVMSKIKRVMQTYIYIE